MILYVFLICLHVFLLEYDMKYRTHVPDGVRNTPTDTLAIKLRKRCKERGYYYYFASLDYFTITFNTYYLNSYDSSRHKSHLFNFPNVMRSTF